MSLLHVRSRLHVQGVPDQQQQQPQQQQSTEEPLPSLSSFPPAAAEPLHADAATTGSSSHTGEVLASSPGEAATQLRHQHSPTAAHSSSEHELTEATQEADVADSGGMSAEELRASKHTAAMAPGIDALRKRRAAGQQQPSADAAESLSQQQMGELQAVQEHDSAAASAETSMPNDQVQTAAQAGVPLANPQSVPTVLPQEHQPEPSQHQALNLGQQPTQPLGTTKPDTPHTGTNSDHHADDISDESGSVQQDRQPSTAETSGVQHDYDSLLDAIAAGELDWEAPAAEQIPSSQASRQQPGRSQSTQTRLEQSPSSDQTSSEQQVRPEQSGATPSNSPNHSFEHATSAAASDGPDQQAATASHTTDKPGFTQQESSPGSQQQSAEAHPSQDPFSTEQSQEPGEAAKQAWPWDARTAAAGTPSLSSDVVARSSSRLRLRRKSSSLQPQKQAGRTKTAAGKAKTLSDLLKSKGNRPSSQGSMQETKWRVTNSQQMTAEEFVKPPSDIDSQRPVWAAAQAAPAAQDGSGIDEEAGQREGESKLGAPPSESRPLTKQELRDLAARRGLDYQRLLADAVSRGIPVSE